MFWCLGMYSSASTWMYNVVQEVARILSPTRTVTPIFVYAALPDLSEATGYPVIKTHAGGNADELGQLAKAIIITIRDPRDAIASLMIHNGVPFDFALDVTEASAWACARFIGHERAILFRYEEGFFDDPSTVGRIAAACSHVLSLAECERIFSMFRREVVEAFIANMEALPTSNTEFDDIAGQWDIYDEVTGWHKHHAGRKGETGRWRHELSSVQIQAIEDRMRQWMIRLGYHLTTTSPAGGYVLKVGRYEINI
jgi:hypothetical protein